MTHRTIKKIFKVKPTIEGAGVHLKRGFGYAEIPQFDPFLLFDDFSSNESADFLPGFPWHPHRGIETVTYILEGEVEHQDSLGNKGSIGTGDIQWMSAGSGIIHQEMPRAHPGGIKGFQLWINLPASRKMSTPQYRGVLAATIPKVEKDGAIVKVIAGSFEDTHGPIEDDIVDPIYFDVSLKMNSFFQYRIPHDHTALIYGVDGAIFVGDKNSGGELLKAGHVALLNPGDRILCRPETKEAHFLLIAGIPIGEPIAWNGPIVMNTDAELRLAFEELTSGTFIKNTPKN